MSPLRSIGARVLPIVCIALVGTAFAQEEIDLSKKADSDGTVVISQISGSIRVIGWGRDEVKVTGTLGKGVERLDFEVHGDKTEIEVVYPKHARNVRASHLEIHAPERSEIEVETVSASIDVSKIKGAVELQSVSAEITISGEPSEVEIECVSGDIEISVNTSEVTAESVSGNVEIHGACDEVKAASVSGNVEIQADHVKRVEAESVSGNILYDGELDRNGRYSFDCFSGTTVLRIPEDTNADFEIETFSGSINNEFNGGKSSKSQNFSIGSGGADVNIDTFSGSVKIIKK